MPSKDHFFGCFGRLPVFNGPVAGVSGEKSGRIGGRSGRWKAEYESKYAVRSAEYGTDGCTRDRNALTPCPSPASGRGENGVCFPGRERLGLEKMMGTGAGGPA